MVAHLGAQTLTDKEYQRLRDASVAIIREMGVECGGSNVQMAINPADGEARRPPRRRKGSLSQLPAFSAQNLLYHIQFRT